ncbi:MAG: hypothetical protein HUJ74_03825 [Lachnospiraceae bacterium]|nr:hypothetical protein [Lachnospiraceae bacterium]
MVLLECGMGGRDDATNVIPSPELVIFSSISLEHMNYLGGSLEKIASVKAGIIKEGTHAVTGKQVPEVLKILRKECNAKQVPLTVAKISDVVMKQSSLSGQKFLYRGFELELSMIGICQVENAVTAYEALKVLREKGLKITEQQIREGMKHTVWNGRFTCIGTSPYFFVDGAHNPDAARKLRTSLETYFKNRRLIYITGIFADKDYSEIIRIMAPLANRIFTISTSGSGRALSAEWLANIIMKINLNVQICDGLEDAVWKAYEAAEEEDVILAFGSLSFIGELTRIVNTYREKRR